MPSADFAPRPVPGRPADADEPLARALAAAGADPSAAADADSGVVAEESAAAERSAAAEKIAAFEALVRRWNRRCGLVSRRDSARLRERHVLDSLALAPWWRGTLADVGSGGGFPGMPLAIARPSAQVVLIERSARKGLFLRQATIDLALANVTVAIADAARYRPPTLFDTVAVRAVAPLQAAWRLVRGLVAPGGTVLLQSGQPPREAAFDGGEVRHAGRCGVAWLTVVGAA